MRNGLEGSEGLEAAVRPTPHVGMPDNFPQALQPQPNRFRRFYDGGLDVDHATDKAKVVGPTMILDVPCENTDIPLLSRVRQFSDDSGHLQTGDLREYAGEVRVAHVRGGIVPVAVMDPDSVPGKAADLLPHALILGNAARGFFSR